MPAAHQIVLDGFKRAEEVNKLLEAGFYAPNDKCDLPLDFTDFWSTYSYNFNEYCAHPNGLELQDSGSGYWKFVSYP
jgi:hypothetical protein